MTSKTKENNNKLIKIVITNKKEKNNAYTLQVKYQ